MDTNDVESTPADWAWQPKKANITRMGKKEPIQLYRAIVKKIC
jgi:hypothetical protein